MEYIVWIVLGYLSGSILFAELLPRWFCHVDIRAVSEDGNPGTFNVFQQCGMLLGSLVLVLELAKGFFPVHMAQQAVDPGRWPFALVLAAPVIGHAFPVQRVRKGGKSIAVSFGALLGLYPVLAPALLLAASYLVFSLVVVIGSHAVRSMAAFGMWAALCCRLPGDGTLHLGALLIASVVIGKHLVSEWKHPGQRKRSLR